MEYTMKDWIINYLNWRKINSAITYEQNGLSEAIEWLESQGEKEVVILIPKFMVGDIITSSKNGDIRYLIKEVGVKNEIGEFDYVMEDISGEPFYNGKIRRIQINSVDEWGVLVKKDNKNKFNVGDWIIDTLEGEVFMVNEVLENTYSIVSLNGTEDNVLQEVIEKNYRIWSINDAKEGDILTWNDSNCIAMFKKVYNDESFESYGFVGHYTKKFETGVKYHDIEGAHPATEEERKTFFTKVNYP